MEGMKSLYVRSITTLKPNHNLEADISFLFIEFQAAYILFNKCEASKLSQAASTLVFALIGKVDVINIS